MGWGAGASDSGDGDVSRQAIASALQVADDGADVGFAEKLRGGDFTTAERVDLAEQVVIAVVGKAADQTQFVGDACQLRHDLREVDSGEGGGDGGKRAANFLGSLRFGVEGIDMGDSATHPEKDDGIGGCGWTGACSGCCPGGGHDSGRCADGAQCEQVATCKERPAGDRCGVVCWVGHEAPASGGTTKEREAEVVRGQRRVA